MPISFATSKEIPVGSAYLGIPTGVDGEGNVETQKVFLASKDDLSHALMFAGFLRGLAARLLPLDNGPIVIYNADDYGKYGADLPAGFIDEE